MGPVTYTSPVVGWYVPPAQAAGAGAANAEERRIAQKGDRGWARTVDQAREPARSKGSLSSLRRNHQVTRTSLRFALTAALAALLLALAPAAMAGKGGGGKTGGTTGGTGSSLSLVLLNSTDGLPHYGQTVTFTVSTTSDRPYVSVNCYQGGAWVYAASAGFFPDYPWSRNFILAATSWPGGAADCTAALYTTTDGIRITTLATLAFHVYA